MTQYLLSVFQPEGEPPSPEVLAAIMADLEAINQEIRAAGAWVFAGGLLAPSTATVVRLRNGEILTTEGPFAEAREYLGGISIIEAPDLDAALNWARRITRAITLPIEVRQFQEEPER
ncbi:YciI family protein [Luethyella okanaganae]|uniref:YciI family protein n=1 Tax=Luethyella okanaganae TaxID=69372 RepID=A0ABW1VF53_9MICO